MTKELTASVPSAMKVKVVAAPNVNIFTIGVKRLRYEEVLSPACGIQGTYFQSSMNAALTSARICTPMSCRQRHGHVQTGL